MPINSDSGAPYAPGATIVNLVKRFRQRGLALPVTTEVLIKAGIPESLVARTLKALQQLELIDDAGNATDVLKKIRGVPEKDFKATLAAWLKQVYAEVFAFADPAGGDGTQVRDAFRTYEPHAQQERMVTLFMALCSEAGLAPEGRKVESKPRVRATPLTPRVTARKAEQVRHAEVVQSGALPSPLAGLLATLPKAWTKADRDRFLSAFTTMLDYSIPMRTAAELDAEKEKTE